MTWLSEQELAAEERAVESTRYDAYQFCVWCVGHGCEDCFFTGWPERWFRRWERKMLGVSRRQFARAAMAWHAWSTGDGSGTREMSMAYGVPFHMVGYSIDNLAADWIREFHGIAVDSDDEDEAGNACAVLASIYMSEAER